MKADTIHNEDGTITLQAAASPAEVAHAFNMAAQMLAAQSGMRTDPMKPAFDQVNEQLNVANLESILEPQAKESLVPFAVDASGVFPAFAPKPTLTETMKMGAPYRFEVNVVPKPTFELTSYDPVLIVVEPYEFPEEEFTAAVKRMAEDYATFAPDDPRPIAEGDAVKLALKATMNGNDLVQLNTEGRTYILGMGMLPEVFDKQILGLEVGQDRHVSFDLSEGEGDPAVVECVVTMLEMQKKIVPEFDDAWVAENMPMYKDAESMMAALRTQMEAAAKRQYDEYKANAAAKEAAKRLDGDIPHDILAATKDVLVGNLTDELRGQGLSLEQFVTENGGQEQFDASMEQQVRQMLQEGYALDAVFSHEGLRVSDEDIDNACEGMDPVDPKSLRRRFDEAGFGYNLRESAARSKAARWLAEHATVTSPA